MQGLCTREQASAIFIRKHHVEDGAVMGISTAKGVAISNLQSSWMSHVVETLHQIPASHFVHTVVDLC